jgi:hypothetical protein
MFQIATIQNTPLRNLFHDKASNRNENGHYID